MARACLRLDLGYSSSLTSERNDVVRSYI